uniref:Putative carboxypeptidase A6 n=1 Tax=Davidia involucrata TaxID=16924 RepID=A0A5B7BQV2_DAVIN
MHKFRYLAHGTATDYMYDIARVPMAFTFEIYGDGTASSKDCFKMFNPIDLATFNRVLNDWSAAFFTIFNMGSQQLDELRQKISVSNLEQWVSIDDYLNGYLMERKNRYGKKMEVLELGMQEIRTYFRLFLLSSVLLMFMFCSRISKSSRPIVAAMPI